MTAFLASTRSLDEAMLAAHAGADWIDLKEPAAGALGAVEPDIVEQVVERLRARGNPTPTSATIGDCWHSPEIMAGRVERLSRTGVDYAKIGLYAASPSEQLLESVSQCCAVGPGIILVCFAEAPPLAADIAAYAQCGIAGVMLDTSEKKGANLVRLMDTDSIEAFVTSARRHGLLCGLAGSLGLDDIEALALLEPDYLGFRGALCDKSVREAGLSLSAVRAVRAHLDDVTAKARTRATPLRAGVN